MPLLAVFFSAAHVGRGIDKALLQQDEPQRIECREVCEIEATIPIQQNRILSVQLQSFFVNEKHRHPGSVLAPAENLFCLVVVRLEPRNFRRAENFGLFRPDIVAKNSGREIQGSEREESNLIVVITAKNNSRPRPGKRNFIFQLPVAAIDVRVAGDILEVGGENPPAGYRNTLQLLRLFGEDIVPGGVLTRGIVKRDPVVGRVTIGPNQELAADVVDDLKGIV